MYKYIVKNGQGPLFDNYVGTKSRLSNKSNGSKGGKCRPRQNVVKGFTSRQSDHSVGSNGGKSHSRQSYATGFTSRQSDVSTVSSVKKVKIQRIHEEDHLKNKKNGPSNPKLVRWRDKCKEIIQKNRDENFQVAVRIRPISEAEKSTGSKEIISVVEDNMVCLLDPADSEYNNLRGNRSRGKTFIFDHAFASEHASQEDVYRQTTKSLIDSVLDGYNATVLAYGPTGTGKTFTMLGTDEEPGIMVLTLNDLYKQIAQMSNDQKYTVKMSYLEIYNEMIRDLLNPSSVFLDLREDSKGVQVAGLSEYEALTTSEIMKMLSRGNKLRMCEPTAVNKTSSRSHAVLQVTVEQHSRVRNITEEFKISKLFMIDLAGSERAAITKNTGIRLIEGAHINRSLLALGNCINALTEKGNKSKSYVNYRDSKLTRLLKDFYDIMVETIENCVRDFSTMIYPSQIKPDKKILKDSLGGNCKTVMIAHVSPASMSFEESKNTLSYADRAKSIKLKAKPNQYSVNYHVAQYQSIISDLREEITRLKSRSAAANVDDKQKSGRASVHSAHVIKKLKDELKSCYNDLLEVRKEIIHLEDSTMQYSVEYQRHLLTIDEWNQEQARRQAKEELKLSKQEFKNIFQKQNNQSAFETSRTAQEPADVTVAREEIQNIQNFLEEIDHRKKELERRLAEHKGEQEFLEKTLAEKVSTEQQKDILDSLCKIHEFQIKNIELEATALIKEYLLEQKDLVIQRNQMRHNLIEEIVDHQKHIIEENHITYPVDLELLYQMYKDHLSRDKEILPFKEVIGNRSQIPTLPALTQSIELTDENSDMDVGSDKFERINIGRIRNKWSSSTTNDQDNMSLDSGQLPTIPSEYVSLVNSTNNLSTKNEKNTTTTADINNNSIQRPERRNTFTLEDQVLKLGEHPSAIISRKQTFNVINHHSNNNNVNISDTRTTTDNKLRYISDNKQNKNYDDSNRNKTYIEYNSKQKNIANANNTNNNGTILNGAAEVEKQLRKRRTFTLDTDVESSVSLMTGPSSEEIEDPLERKRSASVGLIREKKSLTRKKKLKSINTQHKKPTWNNNFNHKGLVVMAKPRGAPDPTPLTVKPSKPVKTESNASVRTLNFINNRYNNTNNNNNNTVISNISNNNNNLKSQKIMGKSKLTQKYSSGSNENQSDILSISGTGYLARGGFGR